MYWYVNTYVNVLPLPPPTVNPSKHTQSTYAHPTLPHTHITNMNFAYSFRILSHFQKICLPSQITFPLSWVWMAECLDQCVHSGPLNSRQSIGCFVVSANLPQSKNELGPEPWRAFSTLCSCFIVDQRRTWFRYACVCGGRAGAGEKDRGGQTLARGTSFITRDWFILSHFSNFGFGNSVRLSTWVYHVAHTDCVGQVCVFSVSHCVLR